jgi:hypothetical protein
MTPGGWLFMIFVACLFCALDFKSISRSGTAQTKKDVPGRCEKTGKNRNT